MHTRKKTISAKGKTYVFKNGPKGQIMSGKLKLLNLIHFERENHVVYEFNDIMKGVC
jgi:hypothetical protein